MVNEPEVIRLNHSFWEGHTANAVFFVGEPDGQEKNRGIETTIPTSLKAE